jgi:hypothetical protein
VGADVVDVTLPVGDGFIYLPPRARFAPPGAAVPADAVIIVPDQGHGTIWRPPCPEDCACFLHEGNSGFRGA